MVLSILRSLVHQRKNKSLTNLYNDLVGELCDMGVSLGDDENERLWCVPKEGEDRARLILRDATALYLENVTSETA